MSEEPAQASAESLATYRTIVRAGPNPETEGEAILELMRRSHALRRKLLMVTLAASLVGGGLGVAFYFLTALRLYGRVAGFLYCAGAILTFIAGHRLSRAIARAQEARWTAELAREHHLDERPLLDAVAIFK